MVRDGHIGHIGHIGQGTRSEGMRKLLHPSAPTPSDVTQTQQPYSYHHQHHHHQQQQHYNELEVKGPLWGPTSRLRPFGPA